MFENILAWQKARILNQLLAKHIQEGKFRNDFKLISQMQDSGGSIMDNIAEGFERGGNREFLQFLYISKGSGGEFRSQCYRALDRKYLTNVEFQELYDMAKEIVILLQGLINYLESSVLKGIKFRNR